MTFMAARVNRCLRIRFPWFSSVTSQNESVSCLRIGIPINWLICIKLDGPGPIDYGFDWTWCSWAWAGLGWGFWAYSEHCSIGPADKVVNKWWPEFAENKREDGMPFNSLWRDRSKEVFFMIFACLKSPIMTLFWLQRSSMAHIKKISGSRMCGEGPHWDASTQTLLTVDIPNQDVYKWDERTEKESKIHIGETHTHTLKIVTCRVSRSYMLMFRNARPFHVFRHYRQWREGREINSLAFRNKRRRIWSKKNPADCFQRVLAITREFFFYHRWLIRYHICDS